MAVSEYLTAYANRELYDVRSDRYSGVQGRWIKRGDDAGLLGFKRIRLLTGPARGREAYYGDGELRLV